jgi:RNA polymerase sigma-70 factor, ECF subfamily
MDNLTIAQIVESARQGSERAYEELVNRFGPAILGYFLRNTGNRADAEDLVGEVFLRLVKGLPNYKEQERFEIWFYRMAHHLLVDYWRKRKIPYQADQWQLENETTDDLPARIESKENEDELQRALAKLPAEQREVILMRYFSGLSFQEISKINGTPIGTALARAHRGLGKLKELLTADKHR